MKRIEDMTLGEISDQIDKAIKKEKKDEDKVYEQIAKDLTEKIMSILRGSQFDMPAHEFRPYGSDFLKGCVKCPYHKDHQIHQVS